MSLSMQIQSRPLLNLNVNKNPFDSIRRNESFNVYRFVRNLDKKSVLSV